ncbi:MAG: MBL fold metallo-hydrolase [Rubricoccaceae bacterium]
MTLAGYRIDALDTGAFRLDGGAMFGIVPRALWARQHPPDEQNRIRMAMRCLLLRGHGRTIVVDTGLGHTYDEKFARIYAVDETGGTLERSLAALGVAPEDVTDVLLTHLHFDHAGGAVGQDAGGAHRLTFSAATHYVQRSHWAWAHESPREQASFLPDKLGPLGDSGRLHLLDGEDAPFPNARLIVVNGHTRGQQLLLVEGDEGALLFAADLLPTAAHVPLLWVMAYDVEPLATLAEKKAILAQAADHGWTVCFEHDPEVAVARIVRSERGGFEASGAQPRLTLLR